MGALYEDVEQFFGAIFAKYARFLTRHPLPLILMSLVTSSLLGMGLVTLRYEKQVSRLYTPMDSQAFKDQQLLAEIFHKDTNRKSFYDHQQVYEGTYGAVIMQSRDGSSIMKRDTLNEMRQLYEFLSQVLSEDNGFGYSELCARRNQSCIVDGIPLLDQLQLDPCLDPNITKTGINNYGYIADINDILGGVATHNNCLTALSFKLRFHLAHNHGPTRDHSLSWERQFLKASESYTSTLIKISYEVSGSLDIVLADDLASDTKYFWLTMVIMVIYASFVASGGDWVSTRMLLAQAGVVAALLSILASFGLMSMCGIVFVDICGVMPFLLLGLGLDDMFILLSGWRRTDVRARIEDRLVETFKSSAISVTITSLTDLLAFGIGVTSPFLSVKNFCIFSGVAVFFCYINQLTFFGGCLVYHARRAAASRHCVTCHKIKPRETMRDEARLHSKLAMLCCSGKPPTTKGQEDSLCEKIPKSHLPKLLLKVPTKIIVLILFVLYIGFSIWGASKLKTGLKMTHIVPDTSYYSQYISTDAQYYPTKGPNVMFCVTQTIQYHDTKVRSQISHLLNSAQNEPFMYNNDRVQHASWLESFVKYSERFPPSDLQTEEKFINVLRQDFLPNHHEFANDVVFSSDFKRITSSRFYLTMQRLSNSTAEAEAMGSLRKLASSCALPLTVYSSQFIYYEHYVSVMKNTLLAVGVAIIGMIFIALMFIPHPISITCVTVTMITIVLGMFGCMHFWGLELSAITKVQIILSVGFCVDYTVHISHAFMTATGKNRNERVVCALENIGVPILNGGVTSILGILMLAFADSYVFKSFFKTMLLVILLGLGHSLLVLPVMLSFIGPKRTSKAVFIPVNPSARSMLHQNSPEPTDRPAEEDHLPSSKQDDLGDTSHSDLDGIELIKLDHITEGRPGRKVLSPVQEHPGLLDEKLDDRYRAKLQAQDSMDSQSFQSLDLMNPQHE